MAKIDGLGNTFFQRNKKSKRKSEGAEKGAAVSRSFLDIASTRSESEIGLTGAEGIVPSSEDLEALLDDVHDLGERLKERPTMERIKEYRKAVSEFLRYVVHYSFEAETIEGARFNPMKKQKRYTLVKVVNEKLERLAAGVLANQLSQLDLLRRVEEINGLLVDLLQ